MMSVQPIFKRKLTWWGLMVFAFFFWFGLTPPQSIHAAAIVVAAGEVTISANGLCSLREAIINANNDAATHVDCVAGSGTDTIQLASGSTYPVPDAFASTDGPTGLPSITTVINITGNGSTITRSGTANYRLFHIAATGDLTLSNLTVSNGNLSGFNGGNKGTGGGGGGGSAGLGGAFYNRGTLTLSTAIISGNRATGGNGGTGGGTTNVSGGGGGGGVQSAGTDAGSGAGAGGGPNGGCPGGDGGGGNGGTGFNGSVNACAGGFGGGGGGGGNASAQNGVGGAGGFGGGGGGNGRSVATPRVGGFGAGNGIGRGGGGLGAGGAIFNRGGTVTATNTVFANNRAIAGVTGASGGTAGTNGQGLGGALFNRNGTVSINNSTFQANIAANGGGGIYNLGDAAAATLTLRNTMLANTPAGTDCAVNTINAGSNSLTGNNNLIESNSGCPGVSFTADPQICTYGIAAASPAINTGDNATCAATDIRGVPRPDGATCDIGAYEFRSGLDDHIHVWDGGGGDGNWSTATNWDNNTVPMAGDNILFNNTSTTNATVSAGASGYAGVEGWLCSVTVDTAYTGTITMTRALRTDDYSQDNGTFVVDSTLTVLDTMTHTGGRLQQTLPVNNANVPFLQIDNGDGVIKYRGVEVNTTVTGGTNLGNVTAVVQAVDFSASEFCTDTTLANYAQRCYTITATTNGTARVRLWALNSQLNGIPQANLSVFRFTTGWTELTTGRATGNDGGSYTYAQGNTPGFSSFLLGQAGAAPTAITVQNLGQAVSQPMGVFIVGLLLLVSTVTIFLLRRPRI